MLLKSNVSRKEVVLFDYKCINNILPLICSPLKDGITVDMQETNVQLNMNDYYNTILKTLTN